MRAIFKNCSGLQKKISALLLRSPRYLGVKESHLMRLQILNLNLPKRPRFFCKQRCFSVDLGELFLR
ncbi:unnamed protein product [Rhizophagus irregularis]|nr:unnamed protein product [Rhizophagus irregularis]